MTATVTAGTGYTVADGGASAEGVVESEDLNPMTARWTQVPSEHNGSSPFLLRFEFSHEPDGYSYRTVHKQLLPGNRRNRSRRRLRGTGRAAGATQAGRALSTHRGGCAPVAAKGRYPHHTGTAAGAVSARIGRATQTLPGTA